MKTKIYSKTNENFPKTKEVREKNTKKRFSKKFTKNEDTKTKMFKKLLKRKFARKTKVKRD